MKPITVAIGLRYDRIDVAAVRGDRVLASRRVPVELSKNPAEWAKAVKGLGGRVGEAVAAVGGEGLAATVLYRSPTQAVSLSSFELRSTDQACQAAILTASESLPYAAGSAICRAVAVGRDRSRAGAKTHVVVVADRLDAVRAIVELVQSAGLRFRCAVPLDGAVLARLLKRALSSNGPQRGWLHFGDDNSFFIIAGQGALRFERTIDIGVKTIEQSLMRPIRRPGSDVSVELDPETAKQVLHDHGVADSEQIIVEDPPLTRRHIMPLIQPVLQRYVIGMRQSLRFGIASPEERKSIDITLTGPGCAVPGFADLLVGELHVDVNADGAYTGFDYEQPAAPGSELVIGLEDRGFLDRVNLQPVELAQRRQVDRLRRWLWTGAAAAVVALAGDGIRLHVKLQTARAQHRSLEVAVGVVAELEGTQTRLHGSLGAMRELETVIDRDVGHPVDLWAVLHELSLLAPDSVRLTTIQARREGRIVRGRITGRAVPLAAGQPETALPQFVTGLRRSPLFDDVILRNVTGDSMGVDSTQGFNATFEIVGVATRQQDATAMREGSGP